jgi:hypothetical protein
MWLNVMGDLPTNRLEVGLFENKIQVQHNGKTFELYPNTPMTDITWWSMLEFANQVSKLHGLEPAYSFDNIHFDPATSAAKGNLVPFGNVPDMGDLVKVNSKSGIYHEARGYRLPNLVEKKYLMNYFKLFDQPEAADAIFGLSTLLKMQPVWGWYKSQAEDLKNYFIHEVATHPSPLSVNGKALHDFMGNILELLFDGNSFEEIGPLNNQLVVPPNSNYRVVFGLALKPGTIQSINRIYTRTYVRGTYDTHGFRLSRTLSPEEVKP